MVMHFDLGLGNLLAKVLVHQAHDFVLFGAAHRIDNQLGRIADKHFNVAFAPSCQLNILTKGSFA